MAVRGGRQLVGLRDMAPAGRATDPNVDAAHAVRGVRMVKLKDLPDMPRVSPDERRKGLAQRVKDYERRLGSR